MFIHPSIGIWSSRLLSGILSIQLALVGSLWADPEGRDLVVERLEAKAKKRDLAVEQLEEFTRQRIALWVLSVGVSEYADNALRLRFADHDAESIAAAMAGQAGVLFDEVHTQVLTNKHATRESIIQAMSTFLGQASQNDVVLIFLAGHGVKDGMTDTYYFMPHNAHSQNLLFAGLPMQTFEEMVKRLRNNVSKVMIWNDTCHAGALQVAARGGLSGGEDILQALEEAEGQYVLSASKAGEISLEDDAYRLPGEKRGHGAFTFALLEGLKGAAADSNGVVWVSELFGHVNRQVPKLTLGRQHPYSEISGSDMPLFVLDRPDRPPAPKPQAALSPQTPPTQKPSGNKTWLWLLLGAATAGGVGAAVLTGGGGPSDSPPATGGVDIRIEIP